MEPTLRDVLELTAKRQPDADALMYPRRDQRWTYAEFDAKANRLANALTDLGIEKGDRVSTLLYNGTEIILTVFACAKIGAVFNPLNYRLPARDIEYVLNDAESSLLVFEEATRERVEESRGTLSTVDEYVYIDDDAPDYAHDFYDLLSSTAATRPDTTVADDDIYAFLYTSGTTGEPKGVVHEHGNVVDHTLICIAEMGFERIDVGLSAFPLYHVGELHANIFPRIQRGATNVIHREFDPEAVLRAVDEYEVTTLFAPPTGWNALIQTQRSLDIDVSSLRLGIYGASPMPEEVIKGAIDLFDADFIQAYGMTELGPCGAFQYPEDQLRKQGSAGVPTLNHDLRIIEPDGDPADEVRSGERGEIILSGPCTMREYWNRPEATAASLTEADGRQWYHTGDIGFLDEDGYLFVVDRKDDMIISNGQNIYPTEVEDVLFSHPAVTEAAVVAEPHEETGERVVAYVVGDTSADALDQYMCDSDRVADFKRPRRYYFVDELPKNPSGKVQKFKLREAHASQ